MSTSTDISTPAESHLLHNLVLFGRILHGLGIEVNPGRNIEVLQALTHVNPGRRSDFYHTLRSLLVNRHHDLPLFDEAFNLFWRKPNDGSIDLELAQMLADRLMRDTETLYVPPPLQQNRTEEDDDEQPEEDDDDEAQEIIEVTYTYSARELLYHKDFANLTTQEMAAIKQVIRQMVWQLGQRRTRRLQPGGKETLDLRRSLRRSFRYGGELLEWQHREQKIKPRPLVILADISGSMERYTRLLIHFLYSLAEGMSQKVEIFTFGTRLTRITRQLKNKDIDQALDDVAQTVQDWSGGTRCGEVFRSFNFEWSRRVLRGGAMVLVISDGWDRGDPALFGQEMARLSRLCHRIVWLNPLLGSERYEPLTRGMQAALPHIDDFLPVHNLASLEDLAIHLKALDGKRPRPNLKLRGAAFVK